MNSGDRGEKRGKTGNFGALLVQKIQYNNQTYPMAWEQGSTAWGLEGDWVEREVDQADTLLVSGIRCLVFCGLIDPQKN